MSIFTWQRCVLINLISYWIPTDGAWLDRFFKLNSLPKELFFFWNKSKRTASKFTTTISVKFGLSAWTVVILHADVVLSKQHGTLARDDFEDTS